MNQLKYEKVCRTAAILIMILGLLMGTRYFWEMFEMIVDDEMWTLPKYRELMFVH